MSGSPQWPEILMKKGIEKVEHIHPNSYNHIQTTMSDRASVHLNHRSHSTAPQTKKRQNKKIKWTKRVYFVLSHIASSQTPVWWRNEEKKKRRKRTPNRGFYACPLLKRKQGEVLTKNQRKSLALRVNKLIAAANTPRFELASGSDSRICLWQLRSPE